MMSSSNLCKSVRFHPNCNYIATGSSDKTCRFWDVQSGECVRVFTGHNGPVYSLSFSRDGKLLASAGRSCEQMPTFKNSTVL
jgi:transcription initiation factor TFIID subunit 5